MTDATLTHRLLRSPLDALMTEAAALRDSGHGRLSTKVLSNMFSRYPKRKRAKFGQVGGSAWSTDTVSYDVHAAATETLS